MCQNCDQLEAIRMFVNEVSDATMSVQGSPPSEAARSLAYRNGVHHATSEMRAVDGPQNQDHRNGFNLGLMTAVKILESKYADKYFARSC
jgi:hypothetical protein